MADLSSLHDKNLVCDCPTMCYVMGHRPARAVPLRFSQEIVVASLMALCPDVSWDGFQWPMLEDLL